MYFILTNCYGIIEGMKKLLALLLLLPLMATVLGGCSEEYKNRDSIALKCILLNSDASDKRAYLKAWILLNTNKEKYTIYKTHNKDGKSLADTYIGLFSSNMDYYSNRYERYQTNPTSRGFVFSINRETLVAKMNYIDKYDDVKYQCDVSTYKHITAMVEVYDHNMRADAKSDRIAKEFKNKI